MLKTQGDSIKGDSPASRFERLSDTGRRGALAHIGRLVVLGGASLSGAVATAPAFALPEHEGALRRPASWQALLNESAATGRPAIVLVSVEGCGFCKQVRRDHLRHLARAPESSRVMISELDISDRQPFTEGSSPAELAASLGIRLAPTVAFFGPEGELAERLVGYNSADFYGAYLEDRIATASAAISRSTDPRTTKGQ
jgi:hypothetical protein